MTVIIQDKESTIPFDELDVGSLFALPCNNSIFLKIERTYTNFNAVNLSENRLANFYPNTNTIEYEGILSVKKINSDFEE